VSSLSDLAGPFVQLGNRGFAARGGRPRNFGDPNPGAQTPDRKLDDNAIRQIAGLEKVRDVYPNLRIPLQMSLAEFSGPVLAVGVPMSSQGEGAFQTLSFGKFFAADSDKTCMLSLSLAKRIIDTPASLLDKNLTLSYPAARSNSRESSPDSGFQVQRIDTPCRLVGIVERESGTFGPGPGPGASLSSGVMIPMAMARTINSEIVTDARSLVRDSSQANSYGTLTVKVKQPQFTQDVEEQLKRMGYTAFSVDDALRGAKNAFIILDIFLSLIGSIALAVSSLGIVNTMVMSILERTREIGIMKAIGASNDDVRRIFLVEASVIGLIGGLAGILLGWVVGRLINFGANVYIQSQGGTAGKLFSLPLWLIASAIAFSILVSLLAGSYPASRAARLDPIRALRHD
jgi:putative ABC transport system permease protein